MFKAYCYTEILSHDYLIQAYSFVFSSDRFSYQTTVKVYKIHNPCIRNFSYRYFSTACFYRPCCQPWQWQLGIFSYSLVQSRKVVTIRCPRRKSPMQKMCKNDGRMNMNELSGELPRPRQYWWTLFQHHLVITFPDCFIIMLETVV